MQTHPDHDANSPILDKFRQQLEDADTKARMKRLEEKAKKAIAMGASSITAGDDPVAEAEYESGDLHMTVRRLPDDPERVLRISVGEMEGVPQSAYTVFRGRRKDAVKLLRQAVWALEHANLPGDA